MKTAALKNELFLFLLPSWTAKWSLCLRYITLQKVFIEITLAVTKLIRIKDDNVQLQFKYPLFLHAIRNPLQ